MDVRVDEPGRDREPGRVDALGVGIVQVVADLDDPAALDAQVGGLAVEAGCRVDQPPPGDDDVGWLGVGLEEPLRHHATSCAAMASGRSADLAPPGPGPASRS